MNMKFSLACVAAALAAGALAEEEAEPVVSDDVAEATAAVEQQKKQDEPKWLFTLPLCRRVHGGGEVLRPGDAEWQPIEEGRFYPLGSSYRAAQKDGLVTVAFGKACMVTVENGASFSTLPQKLGERSRTVVLTGGDVVVSLPTDLKPGYFSVTTPGFAVRDMAGDSKFAYADKGDGYEAEIRCVTGSLAVEGRNFKIPAMRAADVLRVRTSHDNLETILYGKSGDYVVKLDRGQMIVSEVQDDGTVKDTVEQSTLDWHLSVSTRVQINRAVPAVGEHMSVTMMTFDSAGAMKNNFAFSEGRPEINTGELVAKPKENADVAKRAAEVTTEAAATETEEDSAEEEKGEESDEGNKNESSDEEEEEE